MPRAAALLESRDVLRTALLKLRTLFAVRVSVYILLRLIRLSPNAFVQNCTNILNNPTPLRDFTCYPENSKSLFEEIAPGNGASSKARDKKKMRIHVWAPETKLSYLFVRTVDLKFVPSFSQNCSYVKKSTPLNNLEPKNRKKNVSFFSFSKIRLHSYD